MKRALALLLIASTLIVILASCGGGLSGTYVYKEGDIELAAFKFDGDKVTAYALGIEMGKGTYKIDGDKIKMTIEDEEESFSYKKDGNKITIDGIEYTKK